MPAQRSTVFGVPVTPHPTLADQLAEAGLHHSSAGYKRAVMTARSAAPARRARLIAHLAPPAPTPIPLPAIEPGESVAAALTGTLLGRLADTAADQLELLDTWFMRSVLLAEMLQVYTANHPAAPASEFRQILTAALEAVYEPTVSCMEQTVWLTTCLHPAWRNAATAWLAPHSATWLADWLRPQPALLVWAKSALVGDLSTCKAAA